MVDYKKLYIDLFNQVSKAIDILKKAQEETVDEFINAEPPTKEVIEFIDKLKRPHSQGYIVK